MNTDMIIYTRIYAYKYLNYFSPRKFLRRQYRTLVAASCALCGEFLLSRPFYIYFP